MSPCFMDFSQGDLSEIHHACDCCRNLNRIRCSDETDEKNRLYDRIEKDVLEHKKLDIYDFYILILGIIVYMYTYEFDLNHELPCFNYEKLEFNYNLLLKLADEYRNTYGELEQMNRYVLHHLKRVLVKYKDLLILCDKYGKIQERIISIDCFL